MADLQRAVTQLEGAGLDPESLARMRILLATALWEDQAHEQAAHQQRRARDDARRLGDSGAPLLDPIERWHTEHDPGPPR